MPDKQDQRGRQARRPKDIPRQGWRDITLRVKEETTRDNLSIIAAGVAFYALLALAHRGRHPWAQALSAQ